MCVIFSKSLPFHWRCQGGGPTSAPRGFINIFCSSWFFTARGKRHKKISTNLHCHKDDRTMMPSVYTQKPVHYNVQMHLCLHFLRNMPFAKENPFCLGSAAFKMRCLAIFAKSLGPTCPCFFCWNLSRVLKLTKTPKSYKTINWDEVQPQIAGNTVDGSEIRRSPVDMENLPFFTVFYPSQVVQEEWFLSLSCSRPCHEEENGCSFKRPANNSHFL